MISEVVMPQMGADMVEGTILKWLKHEGDEVARGEIIAEIETDKANVEIEAFESGIFRATLAHEGDVVPVGGVIAVIAAPTDDISQYANGSAPTSDAPPAVPPAAKAAAPAEAQSTASAPASAAPQSTPLAERPPTPPPPRDVRPPQPLAAEAPAAPAEHRLRVSPVARRIAEERGIDLRTVRGSGPDGRIIKRDLDGAPPSAAPSSVVPQQATSAAGAPDVATPVEMTKMRQAIARRMAQSKREAPHYYLLVDIDMTAASSFRTDANAALPQGERISVNDLIVRACALALAEHPAFNATVQGDAIERHSAVNVCIAIAKEDGLIAPALLDTTSLAAIARGSKDLVARAKSGALRAEELTAGTFTVTNLGAFGVETLIGIIQPPQTAILGTGSVMPQVVARDGVPVVREMMKVALSADHRVTDGAQGARFLAEIKRLLEQPLLLVL
ncbi:MAG: 2-oxo acid dehydrogenase subunit E2 [Chloroflexi bacterium]|nr:2-oxo acid dehydrogenase subunit E2 [Chloroflexota bacterium]